MCVIHQTYFDFLFTITHLNNRLRPNETIFRSEGASTSLHVKCTGRFTVSHPKMVNVQCCRPNVIKSRECIRRMDPLVVTLTFEPQCLQIQACLSQ